MARSRPMVAPRGIRADIRIVARGPGQPRANACQGRCLGKHSRFQAPLPELTINGRLSNTQSSCSLQHVTLTEPNRMQYYVPFDVPHSWYLVRIVDLCPIGLILPWRRIVP